MKYQIYALLSLVLYIQQFVVSSTTSPNAQTSASVNEALKPRFMYFLEPFLHEVKIHNFKMEGAYTLEMANSILASIDKYLEKDNLLEEERATFISFHSSLQIGVTFATDISSTRFPNEDSLLITQASYIDSLIPNLLSIQEQFLKNLKRSESRTAIIPITWFGSAPHATALHIKWNESTATYDLAFINTGDGLEFHRTVSDPEKVYPFLSKVWVKFEKVPEHKVFDDVAWFLHALIYLTDKESLRIIEKEASSAKNYFYGTILANFKEYEIINQDTDTDTDRANEKLIPMQRSGSCTLSSLMASFLYHCPDGESFYLYRLRFGRHFISEFLDEYQDSPEFIHIITDSFETIGRNLFTMIASTEAQQMLQYLEHAFRSKFAEFPLSGLNRSSWIQENKAQAIELLENDHKIVQFLKDSVNVSLRILKILKENPRNIKNSLISADLNENKLYPACGWTQEEFYEFKRIPIDGGINYSLLNTPPRRSFAKINSTANMIKKLCELGESNLGPDIFFTTALDIFRRRAFFLTTNALRPDAWWKDLDKITEKQAKDLLNALKKIMYKFMTETAGPTTFEDVVLLAHIQLAAWKAALAYDNSVSKSDPSKSLGLAKFHPPRTIQNLLVLNRILLSSRSNWIVRNVFNFDNLKLFKAVIAELENSTKSEVFTHPSQRDYDYKSGSDYAHRNGGPYFDSKVYWDEYLQKDTQLLLSKEMYSNIHKNQNVQEAADRMARRSNKSEWRMVHGTISVAFTDSNLMEIEFFQFDALMKILFGIITMRNRPMTSLESESNLWMKGECGRVSGVKSNLHEKKAPVLFNKGSVPDFCASTSSLLIHTPCKPEDLFYRSRHSEATFDKIESYRHNFIVSLETWLNFVKYSKSSAPFKRPYFVYLSDQILNMPQFTLTDNNFSFDDPKSTYPDGFSTITITEVYTSLTALIGKDLTTLALNRTSLKCKEKSEIVSVVTEISTILVRFIDRIEHDRIIFAESSALMLAKMYNVLYPFSKLSNDFYFSDSDISSINLTLTHISSVTLRNGKTFIDTLQISDLNINGFDPHRRTLAKFHWFLTKLNYRPLNRGMSVADDQFNYGFIDFPIIVDERALLRALLLRCFLSVVLKRDLNKNNYSFDYFGDGNIIKFEGEGSTVYIQLNEGKYILNGLDILSNTTILDHPKFHSFFPQSSDRVEASKGFLSKSNDGFVYILHALKSIKEDLVIISDPVTSSYNIFRKWHNNWYTWYSDEKQIYSFIFLTNYKYLSNSKLFIRKLWNNFLDVEILLFRDGESEPVMRVVNSEKTVSIFISDFNATSDVADGWIKLRNKESKIEKHLEHFSYSSDDHIYAKTADERLVIIYPGFYLPEDAGRRPLVLLETHRGSNIFEILNVPDYHVNVDQLICNSIGLPGSLSVLNGEKKLLLLPRREVLKRSESEDTQQFSESTIVETISIIENEPAPQTRTQKLLLAYYYTLAFEYKKAKDVLHPLKSFHQNEALNAQDIEIISWIISIRGGGPEGMAVKIIAFMHILVNQQKFPQEYRKPDKKGEVLDILDGMTGKIRIIYFNYLMSIREISERFYIHRIFPEVLSSVYWNITFDSIKWQLENNTLPFNTNLETGDHDTKSCNLQFQKNLFIKSIGDSVFFSLLKVVNPTTSKELKLWKRFILRRNAKSLLDNDLSMASYCYISDPEMWRNLLYVLKHPVESDDNQTYLCKTHYNDSMKKCHKEYKTHFVGINQSNESTRTETESIRKTLSDDFQRKTIDSDFSDKTSALNYYVLNDESASFIQDVKQKLLNVLKHNSENNSNLINEKEGGFFDDFIVKRSKCLSKLTDSIDSFIVEKAFNPAVDDDEIQVEVIREDLEKLESFLQKEIESLEIIQADTFEELISKTNSENYDPRTSHVTEFLNRLMHQRKSKSFSDLYSCYFKNSLSCFQQKFSFLNAEECAVLQQNTFIFYTRQVLLDFYLSAKVTITKLFLDPALTSVSTDDLEMFCDELAKISDLNSRHTSPAILLFEFRSKKYRLRSEQVKDVETLTTIDPTTSNFVSVVIQRMMAAGKTLVLGTISVVKKAQNHKTISILVPPSSLYQSNTTAMQERTYKYFKRKGDNFIFPRFPVLCEENSEEIATYLDNVINLLNDTMESGNYLILSPDSLHSFLNSYLELLNVADMSWNESLVSILKKFADIYNIFKQKGSIILDEIDMTMDPRKELNFPTTEVEPYNTMAASLMADIIEFTIFDKNIKELGLDILGNNQASLTSNGYELCRRLIFDYIEAQLKQEKSIWRHLVLDRDDKVFLNVVDVMGFLRNQNMEAEFEWIESLYTKMDFALVDSLIIIKLQLYKYFEDSLQGTVNQNYGSAGSARPSIKFAVPYVAANTPSSSSVFADRWETLDKTLLMTASVPCSLQTAKDVISHLKKVIMSEDTKTSQARLILKHLIPDIEPESLDPDSQEDSSIIHQVLQERSPAAIKLLFGYVLKSTVKEMNFHVEQITSNALNMTSMFASVQGYSGTIDNVNILPNQVVSNAHIDHINNEKNNGGIALKLIKDCENDYVPELGNDIFTKSVRVLIREMIDMCSETLLEYISAIIDTGAFLKNFKNSQVAEGILLEFPRIQAVLFYDEDSNQLEFLRRSTNEKFVRGYLSSSDPETITNTTHVRINERFTFYDQRHITGSDILQAKHAHALMTIAPRVLLRDILQGTLRMRQFMTTQQVHLITTESTRGFYYSKTKDLSSNAAAAVDSSLVRVSDILILGSLNEDEKQRNENQKLAFVKIDNEIRSFVLTEISLKLESSTTEAETAEVQEFIRKSFKKTRSIFIRTIKENPISMLQKESYVDSNTVLMAYYKNRLSMLNDLTLTASMAITTRFNDMKDRIEGMVLKKNESDPACLLFHLPEQILYQRGKAAAALGTEIQMELASHTQTQLNLDQHIMVNDGSLTKQEHSTISLPKLCDNLTHAMSGFYLITLNALLHEGHAKIYESAVNAASLSQGHRVGISRDLIEIYRNQTRSQKHPIFTQFTIEGSHLLIHARQDKVTVHVYLISINNALNVYQQLSQLAQNTFNYDYTWDKKHMEGNTFWLCDLSGRVSHTSDKNSVVGSNVLDFIPEARIPIFDALIFNGSLTQILANNVTEELYRNTFLKGSEAKHRATFLLLRMNALMKKMDVLFEPNDPELRILNNVASGGTISDEIKESVINESQIPSLINNTATPHQRRKEEDSVERSAGAVSLMNEIFRYSNVVQDEKTALSYYDTRDLYLIPPDINLDRTGRECVFKASPIINPTCWLDIAHMAEDDKPTIENVAVDEAVEDLSSIITDDPNEEEDKDQETGDTNQYEVVIQLKPTESNLLEPVIINNVEPTGSDVVDPAIITIVEPTGSDSVEPAILTISTHLDIPLLLKIP